MSEQRTADAEGAKRKTYMVLFEPVSEGGYNVIVPAIPEICTFGSTFAEARQMAEDAIRCYLESVSKDQATMPRDIRRVPRIARLKVSALLLRLKAEADPRFEVLTNPQLVRDVRAARRVKGKVRLIPWERVKRNV